jgi:hypothetical protein
VAWDLLAFDDRDLRAAPQGERRELLEVLLRRRRAADPSDAGHPDPERATTGSTASRALDSDGVVAKRLADPTNRASGAGPRSSTPAPPTVSWPVSAGTRTGPGRWSARCCSVFSTTPASSTTSASRPASRTRSDALVEELAPLRENALDGHPWAEWAEWEAAARESGQRMPGATSRWNRDRDLSWEPLRAERVCEVAYDHLQGDRFRHATTFRRWRPDKPPSDCRYDQLESTAPFELTEIFGR